jgi:hypothetical protein
VRASSVSSNHNAFLLYATITTNLQQPLCREDYFSVLFLSTKHEELSTFLVGKHYKNSEPSHATREFHATAGQALVERVHGESSEVAERNLLKSKRVKKGVSLFSGFALSTEPTGTPQSSREGKGIGKLCRTSLLPGNVEHHTEKD